MVTEVKNDVYFNPSDGPISILELGEKIMPGDIVQGPQYRKYWRAGLLVPYTKENVLSYARRGSVGARYLMRRNPSEFTSEQLADVREGMKAKFKDITMDKWLELLRDIDNPQIKSLTRTDWVMLARFLDVHITNDASIDDIYGAIVAKYDAIINPTKTRLV